MGPQSERTISKHKTTQNRTPECKNHIKTYNKISTHMMTQNGTPECKNHMKTYDDTKWDPKVLEPDQNI